MEELQALDAGAGAVIAIADLQARIKDGEVVEEDGKRWLYYGGQLKPITWDPQPGTVEVGGLEALTTYLNHHPPFPIAELLAIVQGVKAVTVLGPESEKTRIRPVVAIAKLDPKITEFKFGQWMEQEEFLISMYAQMNRETGDFKELVEYASHIVDEEAITATDDGVSQSAVLKRGLKGGGEKRETAPSIVTLTPFRTFREITQPSGMFVFRMRKSSAGVMFALFEADGGQWRLEAANGVAGYLEDNATGLVVA